MRYSAIYFHQHSNIPHFSERVFHRDGKTAILATGTTRYNIITIDNETDILFTAFYMAIPETHPYYNYGLLLKRTIEDIKLSTEVLIRDAVKKLFDEKLKQSKPI